MVAEHNDVNEEHMPPDSTGEPNSQHAYSAPGSYNVILTIKDDEGDVGTDSVLMIVLSAEEAK